MELDNLRITLTQEEEVARNLTKRTFTIEVSISN